MAAPQNIVTPVKNEDTIEGFFFALTAYLLWGFLPLLLKATALMSPVEVIAHRIIWSVPVAGAVLLAIRRTADLKAAIRSPKILAMAALTASIITINWGTYVWAVGAGHTVEAALGYYINPLFSIFLASVLLREKLTLGQWGAIGLAAIAVVILSLETGGLPWVSLILMFSWGFYAFFRKTLPVGPNQGFFLEVAILSIAAVPYVIYLQATGQGHFGSTGYADMLLLLACGLATAIPLMMYANGAKRLRLSTIGIMQYISPTLIFLIAVFVFHEPFSFQKLIAFGFIWSALIIYSWPMIRNLIRKPPLTD
ncbi:EamA family transporter RarD [Rhizobium sp. L1K21]|uniref:EamA family transporter RarD n=1 Tax=Rhizobium sp. L1K21 TaxID=2954933 RepID=UPI00209359BC|nr:EamA family transporter RarD [Rhizobium sp. L1K21]MCO6186560.1 EamA family transporter RarD [Rhizobium sp. L1K21]